MRFCMMNTYQPFILNTSLSLDVVKTFCVDYIATFQVFPRVPALAFARLLRCACYRAQRPAALRLATPAARRAATGRRLHSRAKSPADAVASPAPSLHVVSLVSLGCALQALLSSVKGGREREHIHVDVFRSFLRLSERPKTGLENISASLSAPPTGAIFDGRACSKNPPRWCCCCRRACRTDRPRGAGVEETARILQALGVGTLANVLDRPDAPLCWTGSAAPG